MCQSWIRLFAWAGIAQSIFCSHSEDVNCVGIKTINILRRLVGVCLQCAIPVTVFPFSKLESTSVIGYKILGFLECLKNYLFIKNIFDISHKVLKIVNSKSRFHENRFSIPVTMISYSKLENTLVIGCKILYL